MSYATLTQSQCESIVGDNRQVIERVVPTYKDKLAEQYSQELYERTYMYRDGDLDDAMRTVEDLIDNTQEVPTLLALYAARACIKEEQRRRIRT